MKKDLIVSLGVDGREKYSKLMTGLIKSVEDSDWHGDVRIYNKWPVWVTPHSQVPYKFKYDIIRRALWDGYTRIYWLDSVMRLVPGKNISDLLFTSKGIVAFHNEGHDLGPYINDTAINGMPVKNPDKIKQCWGGALFFDFSLDATHYIFSQIDINSRYFKDDATVREGFIAHRHDQAIVSVILNQSRIPLLPYGVIAAAKDVTDQTYIQYGD